MKKVLVMMSTFNGEKYLRDQINSILHQKEIDVWLHIRDDGSTDATKQILAEYSDMTNVKCYYGENVGYAKSFWKLVMDAEGFDYYAFSDQDDFWKKEKLYNAIRSLSGSNNEYCLYSSGLELVDENLKHLNNQRFTNIRINLGSALVRQRLAGCTMVFNNKLLEECKKCKLDEHSPVNFGHDGLLYLICLSVNGDVILSSNCDIKFRRHSSTQTSGGRGLVKRVMNEFKIFNSKKGNKYDQIHHINTHLKELISSDNQELIQSIVSYKETPLNTIKLLFNKELDCGIKIINYLMKFAILVRCF